jgi:hypothetical protein
MHIAIMSQKVRWFGGKIVDVHLVVQGSILSNELGCGQQWGID